MLAIIPTGVKYRKEAFGGIVQSPEEILLLEEDEYKIFLDFRNSSECNEDDDFIQKLLEAGALEPFVQ